MMKKIRIFIFEDDPAVSTLLELILQREGRDISVFSDPTVCNVYLDHETQCPRETPCADVILSDNMMPNMTGIDFFLLQRARGCKALARNKAIMTAASIGPETAAIIKDIGCQFLKKPFNIVEIKKWVDGCSERTLQY